MFNYLFNIFTKNSAKVQPSKENKIAIAKACVANFLENSFNVNHALMDRDGADPRTVIYRNANHHIRRIEQDDINNEEFNILYNELVNIGHTAYPGHPLNRNLEQYPHQDNSFWGRIGRIFAPSWDYERRPDSTLEEVSEYNSDPTHINEPQTMNEDISLIDITKRLFMPIREGYERLPESEECSITLSENNLEITSLTSNMIIHSHVD